MELFSVAVAIILTLSILGFAHDSRPSIGDDWRRFAG